MTTETTVQNIVIKNCDGDTYSIPETMKDQFSDLNDAIDKEELGTDEWFRAHDEFNDVFGNYLKV